jgi:hypothetical protein
MGFKGRRLETIGDIKSNSMKNPEDSKRSLPLVLSAVAA